MAIHHREFEPGEIQHLTQGGNAGKAIYASDADRACAVFELERWSAYHEVTVLFFHLHDNHGHWVVIPKTADGISNMMRDMQREVSRAYNERHCVRAGLSPTSTTKFSNFGARFDACKVEVKDLGTLRKYITVDPSPYGTDLGEPEPEFEEDPIGQVSESVSRQPAEDRGPAAIATPELAAPCLTAEAAVIMEIFGAREGDQADVPDELTLEPHEYRIVKAIRLATKWNRPVEYAKQRLAECEARIQRAWRIRFLIASYRFESG